MAGIYTDPLDFIISNYIPLMIHTTMIMSHQFPLYIWSLMTVIGVVFTSHSGYDKISNFHDDHHKSFNYNFGLDNFMDKLCKTHYKYDFKQKQKLKSEPLQLNNEDICTFEIGKKRNKRKHPMKLRHRKFRNVNSSNSVELNNNKNGDNSTILKKKGLLIQLFNIILITITLLG